MRGDEKQTSLRDGVTISKGDPLIGLRGAIDSLHAKAVYTCVFAKQYGYADVVAGMEDVVRVTRELMRSEALDEPPDIKDILGMGLDEIRLVSNNPQTELGIPHYMPDENADEMTALLNVLRTEVRDAERIAAGIGGGETADGIQMVLNRLSGAVYILMLENWAVKGI
jgi:ethanolamine utilization cobalamin adenosyltransferase